MRRFHRLAFTLVLASALASCGGSRSVTRLVAPPPGVTVSVFERPYDIEGEDEATLAEQMRTLGPGRFYGRFDWRIEYRYRYAPTERRSINRSASRSTECEITDLDITLILTTTMPRWSPPSTASEGLVGRWAVFERNLRVHEEGHRDVALGAATELWRRFRDLRTPACGFMQSRTRQLFEEVMEKWNERSHEYDETTGHGRTQGAIWPPRAGRPGGTSPQSRVSERAARRHDS